MLHLLQMGSTKVLTTFPVQIQSSWQLSLLELPPCRNTMSPSSDSSDMQTSTVQSSPVSASAALSPHPRLQTSYPPSAHSIPSPLAPHHCPLLLAVLLCLLPPPPPLTLSGFFNGTLEVFKLGTLNHSTFFRSILSTLSVSRNPILIHLPLSRFLFSALYSDRTHSRSGILSSDTTHASGGVVNFVRQCLSFSELSTSSLSSLDPYSDYVGVNISLNNSSSLSFLNVYAPLLCRTDSFSPSILPISRNIFILGDFNYHHPL